MNKEPNLDIKYNWQAVEFFDRHPTESSTLVQGYSGSRLVLKIDFDNPLLVSSGDVRLMFS